MSDAASLSQQVAVAETQLKTAENTERSAVREAELASAEGVQRNSIKAEELRSAEGAERSALEETQIKGTEQALRKSVEEEAEQEKIAADLRSKIQLAYLKNLTLKDTLAEKTTEAAECEAQSETVKKELKEANDVNNKLVRDLTSLQKQNADIAANYERCLANHDLKERAEALKNEIAEEEAKAKRLEMSEQDLKKNLADVSAKYKTEREARESFEQQLANYVIALRNTVDTKLAETGVVDDEENENFVDPNDLIEVCIDLARNREQTYVSLIKQHRELEAVCAMQKNGVEELEVAVQQQVQSFATHKDEEIRELVYSLQDERNALLADIDEISRVNGDQKINLQKGHVQKSSSAAPGVIRAAPVHSGGRVNAAGRESEFRKVVEPSEEVKLLQAKNREITLSIVDIKSQLVMKQANRTAEMKAVKVLESQMKEEKKQYMIALNRLESSIAAERSRKVQLELENSRLAEAIDHLSGTLKATKKHIENVRGKTAPLPVE